MKMRGSGVKLTSSTYDAAASQVQIWRGSSTPRRSSNMRHGNTTRKAPHLLACHTPITRPPAQARYGDTRSIQRVGALFPIFAAQGPFGGDMDGDWSARFSCTGYNLYAPFPTQHLLVNFCSACFAVQDANVRQRRRSLSGKIPVLK
jgi:hypothetical protein